jgi:hypothetical protein
LEPAARDEILAERTKLAAAEPPSALAPGEAAEVRRAVALSFVSAFRTVTRASAALALLAAACGWVLVGRLTWRPSSS